MAVMRRSGRYVPLFNDKHLSYSFDHAKAMYDEARTSGFALMVGVAPFAHAAVHMGVQV